MELVEYRCTCDKLLFKGMLRDGVIEVKCKSCHKIARWEQTAHAHACPLYMVKASNEGEAGN